MRRYPRIDIAIKGMGSSLLNLGQVVQHKSWQSTTPPAPMFEALFLNFECPMPKKVLDMVELIKPNLPWADLHFEERVGGEPLNPPPSHVHWPFASKNNTLHTDPRTLEFSDVDLAYLAAMIDGDGCITIKRKKNFNDPGRPEITISQKDHAFIDALYERYYPLGMVFKRVRDNIKTPDGKIRRSNPAIWRVSNKQQTKILLEKLIPFLMLKKQKAIEALEILNKLKPNKADKPFIIPGEAQFSHTYPERFWPKLAGGSKLPHKGIRFEYGDLNDVVKLLTLDPTTRQAYLPVWNNEDTGAVHGKRVPCTLGYHFLIRSNYLHLTYYIRSCDYLRHFQDDVYLAMRLAKWVAEKVTLQTRIKLDLGVMRMDIGNLHIFDGEQGRVKKMIGE